MWITHQKSHSVNYRSEIWVNKENRCQKHEVLSNDLHFAAASSGNIFFKCIATDFLVFFFFFSSLINKSNQFADCQQFFHGRRFGTIKRFGGESIRRCFEYDWRWIHWMCKGKRLTECQYYDYKLIEKN